MLDRACTVLSLGKCDSLLWLDWPAGQKEVSSILEWFAGQFAASSRCLFSQHVAIAGM